jgi:hypothetical protein
MTQFDRQNDETLSVLNSAHNQNFEAVKPMAI